MIYVDAKSEVLFKSMSHAGRATRIKQESIKHNDRDVIFRIVKDK